ncbi:MAG: hypothetical protein GY928_12820 [Colwellia sp.]|nr:hypothetical protein [Colwellia sp.]
MKGQTLQKSISIEQEAHDYVEEERNSAYKESFSACLSRLLLEHKNEKSN